MCSVVTPATYGPGLPYTGPEGTLVEVVAGAVAALLLHAVSAQTLNAPTTIAVPVFMNMGETLMVMVRAEGPPAEAVAP
jgi:hypothetical protein